MSRKQTTLLVGTAIGGFILLLFILALALKDYTAFILGVCTIIIVSVISFLVWRFRRK